MASDRLATPTSMKNIGENVVRIEAEALRALADRIAGAMAIDFERAIELLDSCGGRVVVSGMGKSGIVARKIAATLSSTGCPALFLHPAEALHGDLGMIARGDVVIALSASGETREILQLLGEGRSMHETGTILNIRTRTVAFHKYRIMEVLGVKSNAALVQYAVRNHVITA